ncbi:MAG: hypothetical protein EG823_02435 [Actinobacteria bacterium]|nr:hypothetical protein [Actinomycetota bacterium]
MPQCAFHPTAETNVRCVECDRPICPKDMVQTPVGYKCKECARQLPSARRSVKPKQLALAALASAAVGTGGAFLLAAIGFGYWFVLLGLGVVTGEAARRASDGHRSAAIAAVAGIAVAIGAYLSGLGIVSMAVATIAAVVYVLSNRW